ncbi:MAG: hypothetical protein ABIT08_09505, partial [Bacteroidia bacterium]
MKNSFINIIKCLLVIVAFCFFFSCKKEHLSPDITVPPIPPPDSTTVPYVYITAFIDNDSVYFAGGLNSYEGATSVFDTLTHRTFNFTMKNQQNPSYSYFQISINNYQDSLGILQNDLDSSIFTGARGYQLLFHPFAP